jgi:hypothetical protein
MEGKNMRALLCRLAATSLVLVTAACSGSGSSGSRPPPTIAELTTGNGPGGLATYSMLWNPGTLSGAGDLATLTLTTTDAGGLILESGFPCDFDNMWTGECVYDEATGALSVEVRGQTIDVEVHIEGMFTHSGSINDPTNPYIFDGTYAFETPFDSSCGWFYQGAVTLLGPAEQTPEIETLRPRGWIYADDGELVGTVLGR